MTRAARGGFTLLETVLAATIGGAVIVSTVGLFALLNRSETVLDRQYTQSRQLGTLQIVLRRSFNTLLMSGDNTTSLTPTGNQNREPLGTGQLIESDLPPWDGTGDRPRVLIQTDLTDELALSSSFIQPMVSDPMGPPQRMELVLPRSPVPASIRLPTQSWLVQGVDVENELEVYGISGSVRGVFELRPNGARELMLFDAGMTPADGERSGRELEPGWTLWYRPVFPDELVREALGEVPGREEMLRAAAEAYPIIRGIKRARFIAFDNGYRKATFAARTATDLPAYVEIEIETYSGTNVNWMFEVGWLNGPDPTAPPPPPENEDTNAAGNTGQDAQGNQNAPGGGTGDGGTGGRPQTTPIRDRLPERPGTRPGGNQPEQGARPTRPGGGGS
jgi:type II secretory pathway pseudopilin PulG